MEFRDLKVGQEFDFTPLLPDMVSKKYERFLNYRKVSEDRYVGRHDELNIKLLVPSLDVEVEI